MSVGCCFLYHLGWGSIKEYQCFEIVENHIIFATSRNSSSIHETWTLQLNNTATPWHTQKESPFYLIIRLLFSTWVHWYVCRVGRGEWGKSLLQYGYIMMCIDFWRQTAGPTVVTNAANVCRRLMRNGWWQCCTQVASLIGETLPPVQLHLYHHL